MRLMGMGLDLATYAAAVYGRLISGSSQETRPSRDGLGQPVACHAQGVAGEGLIAIVQCIERDARFRTPKPR
jgi:hypothetical protein